MKVKFELNVSRVLCMCYIASSVILTLIVGTNLIPMIWETMSHGVAIFTAGILALSEYLFIVGLIWETVNGEVQ